MSLRMHVDTPMLLYVHVYARVHVQIHLTSLVCALM